MNIQFCVRNKENKYSSSVFIVYINLEMGINFYIDRNVLNNQENILILAYFFPCETHALSFEIDFPIIIISLIHI